jgi:eukaryotic-like serine/threonine-protein kinase
MPLGNGARIGPYEIVSAIGAGGMGEVYRARDTKLGRDVALKVIPDSFALDPDRLARFKREAQVLASLNHPHIAAIYGFEDSGETHALVLELVEGETLADRIAHGPISIDEAFPIARQICEALEAAHEHGIIHRDLKPSNIKITPDGVVKALDFGLAKLAESAGGGQSAAGSELSLSPTITSPAMMTGVGILLGTAAYMSPEQAKGRPADKRSDVWAFGCVLYEMLTGKRPFDGEDVSDTLAFILTREPDWSALPLNIPAAIRRLLRRCLDKNAKERLRDIGDARLEIKEALTAPTGETVVATPAPAKAGRGARLWPATAAALLLATLALAAAVVYLLRSTGNPAVVRFVVSPPEKTAFNFFISNLAGGGSLAFNSGTVSPDGQKLIFTLQDAAGKVLLWVRPIDSLAAQPLPGTEDPTLPFWSPDSRFVGFFSGGKLKKIDVTGGPPLTLSDAPAGRGGAWNRDGVIVFAPSNNRPLYRVSAAGGEPVAVTKLQSGEAFHRSPSFLPDGRHFVYRAQSASAGIFLGSLDSEEPNRIQSADTQATYTASGYLLFVRQGTLLAQPFDAKKLRLTGDPFPIAERVVDDTANGLGAFSVSDNGVLTYRTGITTTTGQDVQMAWFDRQGKQIEPVGTPAAYRGLDLSSDGMRVAAHRHDGQGGDIWLLERTRGTISRFTFDASQDNGAPLWSPDGSRIVFNSLRGGSWGLYQKLSNGAGNDELLLRTNNLPVAPMSWSPDGRFIVYWLNDQKTLTDLWVLPMTGDRKAFPFAQTPFAEYDGQVSPDSRWIAYASNETGRSEVYVRPFPSGAGKWQISTDGGSWSQWRRDGKELLYMGSVAPIKLFAVDVKANGATFEAGVPKGLFDTGVVFPAHAGGIYRAYAASRDGQRFLIARSPSAGGDDAAHAPITVVVNWTAALKR